MIGLEARPNVAELVAAVDEAEYARMLEWPRSRPLEGLVRERAEAARAWYA